MRLAFLALLLAPLAALAQDDAPRWGRLSDADKALESYPDDPDAGAVVLWDGGEAEVAFVARERFELRVRRHRRVKILQESGYALGEFSFRFSEDDDIRGIRGQTFVPQPDGSYERVELNRRSILEEEVRDGVREVRFSMPALAPGAIFEFSYDYESEHLLAPPVWFFQSSEPTLVSHYSLEVPELFDYVVVAQGGHIETTPSETRNGMDWRTIRREWTARDVPALREEPYTTTEADYANKVEAQLRAFRPPYGPPEMILHSWAKVAEDLGGNDNFGRRLRRNRRVEELAASVSGTPAERTRALYDLVRTEFVWNEQRGIFAERDLDAVVETRSGSSGELGLLLLALLREADVTASPVLISTRSNGRVVQQYPFVGRFDHLLVLAQPDGADPVLLDAADPHRPYGQLPVEALSGEGWVCEPGADQWITFGAPADSQTRTYILGTLGADGAATGDMRVQLEGYPALNLRASLAAEAADAPAASAEATEAAAAEAADATDDVALDLQAVLVEGLDDPYVPVSMRGEFSAQAGEVVGDEIYLTPFVAMRLDENPFSRATRSFPVDFAYPSSRAYTAQFTLPEGFEPESLPTSTRMSIPSGAVTYTRRILFGDGLLRVQTSLDIAAASVMPEEYAALRSLYDEIVASESEVIVLVKSAPEAGPVAESPAPEAASEPEEGGR